MFGTERERDRSLPFYCLGFIVKITFLSSVSEEEIYIAQWEGCEIKGQENKICKLLESLHDFKQTTDNGMGNLIIF